MISLLCFFLTLFASPSKSKSRLEAENAALRHQLIVLQRGARGETIAAKQLTVDEARRIVRQHCEVAETAEGAGVIPASPPRLPSGRVLSERGNESEP
jgi:hypothetical protein